MTFKNLFIEHEQSPEVKKWIEEEIAEQEARYNLVVKQMGDLAPKREQWYQEFFDRITTSGFNEDGDMKVVIKKEDLPVKTDDMQNKVIWKYGVDGE